MKKQANIPSIYVEVVDGGFIITVEADDMRLRGKQRVTAGDFDELMDVLDEMAIRHVTALIEEIKDAPAEFENHPASDREPNPDCPPQEYRIPDDMASNIVAPSFDASPFLDIMDSPLEESPLVQQIKRRVEQELNQEVEEACDELGINVPEPTHEETRAFRALMDRIEEQREAAADQARTGWRGHANAWRNEVRRMPDGEKLRALGQMRGLVKAIEDEEGVVIDGNGVYHRASVVKTRCSECNDTGWIPRGEVRSGVPFSQNYMPCWHGCDGGRGHGDPIPYDPKTGKIVTPDTEGDGA